MPERRLSQGLSLSLWPLVQERRGRVGGKSSGGQLPGKLIPGGKKKKPEFLRITTRLENKTQ